VCVYVHDILSLCLSCEALPAQQNIYILFKQIHRYFLNIFLARTRDEKPSISKLH